MALIDARRSARAADPDAHVELLPSGPSTPTDALLEAIYQTAMNPDGFERMQHQLLSCFREDRSRDETPLTRVVLSHLRRALRLGVAHSAMHRERQRVLKVIDAVAPPVVVVDDLLRVVGLNHAAASRMGDDTAFGIRNGVLWCREPAFLTRLVQQADQQPFVGAGPVAAHDDHPVGSSGQAAVRVYAYRNQAPHGTANRPTYSLLLIDQHRCFRQSIERLGCHAGLTPREVDLIDLAVQGLDPEAICVRAGIALHTLRQHTRNIYAKTGVHNQNGLFALVLRNVVLEQAGNDDGTGLLPHVRGLAQSRTLRLADGRQLSYAEFGAPDGIPVLHFHALNASRLELLILDEPLRRLGVRLIAMDRAGYGHSPFVERHDYLDYTADVEALLDELRLDTVHALSASAGCAHALHAAWTLPHRIRSVHCTAVVPPIGHILASDSPSTMNSMMNRFFRVVPSLLRPAMELALYGQTVESLLAMATSGRNTFGLAPSDVAYMTEPAHLPYFQATMMESLRQGSRAWAMESELVNRPWSIDPSALRVPVHFWHGSEDGLVPADMVAGFAADCPGAQLTVVPGQTHMFLFHNLERVVHAIRADRTSVGMS